jgi:hypothetical protein
MLYSGMISPDDLSWHEGLTKWKPLYEILNIDPSPIESTRDHTTESWFFYIPEWQLVTLSIITCGLYQNYWVYKNWKYLRNRDNLAIRPFWRGVFSPFYIEPLLKKISLDKQLNSTARSNFSYGARSAAWLLLWVLGVLFPAGTPATNFIILIILLLRSLTIMDIQSFINKSNQNRPQEIKSSIWTIGQTVTVLLGAPWFIIVVFISILI